MGLVVGVDGGGTKTHVLAVNSITCEGIVVGGKASRTTTVGYLEAAQIITALVLDAATMLGAGLSDVTAVSLCLSGIDSDEQAQKMLDVVALLLPKARLEVVNDTFAVLAAGSLGQSSIAVIGGTGSIAVGEDWDGKVARVGGYGNFLGDEGSGFDIGNQGLTAAIRSFEGRGPRTVLWERAAEQFSVNHPLQMMTKVYDASNPVGIVASFASVVLAIADDAVADEIVRGAVLSYQRLIESVYHLLNARVHPHVVLAGGIFRSHPKFVASLKQCLPNMDFKLLDRRPVMGALLRATRLTADTTLGQFEPLEVADGRSVERLLEQFRVVEVDV